MTGVDTNVLVRYLTQDDASQARRANTLIAEATAGGRRCFIGPVVLCELFWVLQGAYGRNKPDLLRTLDLIIATKQFEIGEKDVVREALEAYRLGGADFADYLIGAANRRAGCDETVTFDRRLKTAFGFRLL